MDSSCTPAEKPCVATASHASEAHPPPNRREGEQRADSRGENFPPGPLLEVRDLTIHFGEARASVAAVEEVSFEIARGEVVGVLGESGSGKTTMVQALARLLPPNGRIVRGTAFFGGRDLAAAEDRELEQVRGAELSLIFQEPGIALHPMLRVGDQVSEVLHAHRRASWKNCRDEALAALAEVFPQDTGRIARSYPHQLSGGQRQRVLIAQALACHPALVIADEPTASLDATTQAEILDLLREVNRRFGVALILVTHNPALLSGLARRVLIMYAGRLVEEGPFNEVYRAPLHPYTQGLLRALPHSLAEDALQGKTKLAAIPGSAPDLAHLPAGCPFEPRCAARMAVCTTREPAETSPQTARRVRCFLHGG